MRTKVNLRFLASICACIVLLTHAAASRADSAPCPRSWTLHASHPHDPTHFTQGLLIHEGRLFESVGQYGRSAVHEIELQSGRVLRSQPLPAHAFGEGLARVGERLVQLSWREQTAWFYTLDLVPIGVRTYPGEGWGLTTLTTSTGERLILSDGTPVLRVLHPDTLAEERRVEVRVAGRPLKWLNELEVVDSELLANIWHSDEVAVIDPASGALRGWFDFSALRRTLTWPAKAPRETDLNGLAWDARRQRLLVTGKHWPRLFEVEIGGCAASAK